LTDSDQVTHFHGIRPQLGAVSPTIYEYLIGDMAAAVAVYYGTDIASWAGPFNACSMVSAA
jgi:hypothetical protein